MSYFEKFPLMTYELLGKESIVRDILRRCSFISEYKPYTDLFTAYTIVDGDTPQSLAIKFYDSPYLHWVILITNEIHNPYFDWPLNILDLEKFCKEKYGAVTMYMTKHWEINNIVVGEVKVFNSNVAWIPPTFTGSATAVSFYDYEQKLNDAKRQLTILRPELLGDFVKQFGDAVNV